MFNFIFRIILLVARSGKRFCVPSKISDHFSNFFLENDLDEALVAILLFGSVGVGGLIYHDKVLVPMIDNMFL